MRTARVATVDGTLFKQALLGSVGWLAANHEEVNRLNVFPVPDGDTGTNMLLTLQSAVEDIKESQATEVSKIARLASHGSLMGARGNSGVILSQIFRGFARAVEGKSSLNPKELAAAFEEAANAAYRAVNRPTEGTILTVAREAGRAATAAAAQPDATPPSVIAAAANGAKAAVEKTPSQLQILRDAGVVDAGGYGLQLILEGMLRSIEEVDAPAPAMPAPKVKAAQVALDLPEEGWGYCTEFLIEGEALDVEKIRAQIEAMGNSVLVVGEPELVKVHVHTDDPTKVIALAGAFGKLQRLSVGFYAKERTGSIVSRLINDIQQAGNIVNGGVILVVMDAVQTVVAVVLMHRAYPVPFDFNRLAGIAASAAAMAGAILGVRSQVSGTGLVALIIVSVAGGLAYAAAACIDPNEFVWLLVGECAA